MDNCTEIFKFDGDIAGIGVRLSFYFQNFILVLLVDRSYEDAGNALWTFIATSFGLTVAALVQVKGGNLSLLEGILVSQLAWLANLGTFLALASYSRSKGEDNLVKVAAVLQGYLSMILTIMMWAWSDRFSGGTPCNHDIRFFFFFAIDLPALGAGRIVGLVFASLTMALYTAVTFAECMAWLNKGKSHLSIRGPSQDPDLELPTNDMHYSHRGIAASGAVSVYKPNKSVAARSRRRHPRHPSRQQWLGTDVDPIFFGIFLTQITVFAYFISTTENIVRKNSTPGVSESTNEWSFGQVLALTVVAPSLIALVRAIQRNRMAKLKKQEKELKDQEASKIPSSPRRRRGTSVSTVNPSLRLNLPIIPPSSPLETGETVSPSSGLSPGNFHQVRRGSSISSTSTSHQS